MKFLQKYFHIAAFSTLTLVLTNCTNETGYGKQNEFHMNISGEPSTLNPISSVDGYSAAVQGYVLESLLDRDPDTNAWRGGAANKWEISKDGMVFTFHLRPGMTFHDGSPVTAEDVKTYYDAVFDNEYGAYNKRPYLSLISKCEVLDPLTIRFTAKEKYFQNFEVLASLTPIPSKYYKNGKEGRKINLNIYGSGPYKLESFERGKKIVLARNNDWWGFKTGERKNEYAFDKIHMYFIDDQVVAFERFKKGLLDFFDVLSPEVFELKMVGPEWGKSLIKVKTQNKGSKGYSYIGLNLLRPQFQDKRVRKALTMLMNREMMIDKFFFGVHDVENGPINTTMDQNDKSVKPLPFDIEKAKALFKEAGWADSNKDGILDKMINGKRVDMSFTIIVGSDVWQKWLTIFKEDAAKAGVNINIQVMDWNSMEKLIDDKNFDALGMAWGGGGAEEDYKQIWHSDSAVKGGSNYISYKNPQVDKLIEEHRRTMDEKARMKISNKIFDLIADDAPYIFMFSRKYEEYAHNARIWKPKDTFTYGVGMSYWKVAQ